MATVYLATDLALQRRVAVKVLRPDLAVALGPERFLREIAIAARLSHPHILALHDSGQADGQLFYVMPYVEGESLRQRLEREQQLAVEDAVHILRAVASALDYAHHSGVVHRDIKPENILLAKDPTGGLPSPLVADFGIAHALDIVGGERLTETGLALGTPAYMAPEQAAGSSRRPNPRSDIYALGCVAYEMLAGTPPFTGPTAQAILARHAVDPVPPLRTVRATVPEPIALAIERALAKVPADRYATAHEFAEALTAGAGTTLRARRATVPGARAVLVATVLAVVLTGAGFVLLRKSRSLLVLPSASRIAVLPFLPPAGDTSLVRLGRDLATTISATLEGVGGIEMADRLAIAAKTIGGADLSPAEGAALARRLGATSVVRGTLVQIADEVRLDLGIYGLEDAVPLAAGITVTAPRDSIGALTDSASWALLRIVWRRGAPPSPSLESVIPTRSIPALRAFLEGERASAEGRADVALLAYGAAIAADSSFSLAWFGQALTQYWMGHEVELDQLRPLRLHSRVLPERERLLIASMTDSIPLSSRIDRLQTVTRRFPNYWPGWFLYADMLYHYAPILGHDWTEAVAAFQRVVALNPRLMPAWEHLYLQASWGGHPAGPPALAQLIRLGWTGYEDQFARLQGGVVAAGGLMPPHLSTLADSLAELIAKSAGQQVGLRLLRDEYPAAQLELNTRALRSRSIGPEARTALRASNAWSWAARGRWDSALTLLTAVVPEWPGVIGPRRYSAPQHSPIGGPALAIESYGIAAVGAWLGALSPAAADQRRPAALAVITQLQDEESRRDARGRIAWFDGILGYVRGSRRQIQKARADVSRNGYRQAAQVDASLATFERALAGARGASGRQLAALELRCINATQYGSFISEAQSCNQFTPHIAIQRLAAAQWLHEAGEIDEAARLLRYQDAAIWFGWRWTFNDALAAPTHLMRARLEEERGDTARAKHHYRQFLRLYDQPMPSLTPLAEEARTALVRLSQRSESGESR